MEVTYHIYRNHLIGAIVRREVAGRPAWRILPQGLADALAQSNARFRQMAIEDWFEDRGWIVTRIMRYALGHRGYERLSTAMQREIRTPNTVVYTIVVEQVQCPPTLNRTATTETWAAVGAQGPEYR